MIVQVSDGFGGIDTQAITVTVTDENESPVITSNGGGDTAFVYLAENTTAITTVTATDPDFGQTLRYSITSHNGAHLSIEIDPTTGVLYCAKAPDFEALVGAGTPIITNVWVQVVDPYLRIDSQKITIQLIDVDENHPPTPGGGGNDTIVGGGGGGGGATDGNDTLFGTDGLDSIAPLGGNDFVDGRGASDLLFGNQGNDTASGRTGNDTIWGGQGNDILDGAEDNDFPWGNEGADTIVGGDGANTLVGGQDSSDAADSITAGSGPDLIFTGTFAACCARAASGHGTAEPPRSV